MHIRSFPQSKIRYLFLQVIKFILFLLEKECFGHEVLLTSSERLCFFTPPRKIGIGLLPVKPFSLSVPIINIRRI